MKALEAPVDIALGSLDAIEIMGYAVSTLQARPLWEGLLSCDFDVVVTAGTDVFLGRPTGGIVGSSRTYVNLEGRPFDVAAWREQLVSGHSFVTRGPLLFLRVGSRTPGEEIRLEPGESRAVDVELRIDSVFPWKRVIVRSNRRDVLSFASAPGNPRRQEFRGTLLLDGPAWVYAHVLGDVPAGQDLGTVEDSTALTNAVWVRRGDEPRRDTASAGIFLDWIDANLATLERRDNYGSAENREVVRDTFLRARRVYEACAAP